jgi:lipopolysaccharide transport system permease protein
VRLMDEPLAVEIPAQPDATPCATTSSTDEIVIRPSRGWVSLRLGDLWRYRELWFFLVWRDIKVRYQQTVLGVAWAFIQPFFTMLVFSLFFGYLGGMGDRIPGTVPYPLFAFAGLVIWAFFAFALTQASDSLVSSSNLIKKVYFPRLILPLSAIGAGTVDFLVAFVTLFGMMAYFGFAPSWQVVFLPGFFILAVITSLGVGLWLSALNVQFRDVKYTLGFLTQIWLFATPIAYPSSLVPEQWRALYGVNPMVGVVEGFRWSLLGVGEPPGPMLAVSVLVAGLMLVTGAFYFRRMEKTFSDLA